LKEKSGDKGDTETMVKAGYLPNWFIELSKNRRRAIARMLEFTDVPAISYNDFDYEVSVLGWQYDLQELDILEVPISPQMCQPYLIDTTKQTARREASQRISGAIQE
jgi:hypothetical protein